MRRRSDPFEDVGDASPGGGAASELDDRRSSIAGAVHHDPVVPGIEVCTEHF